MPERQIGSCSGFVFSLAASGTLPETRVWGSDFENQPFIGASSSLSSTTRWGCGYVYGGTASGLPDQRFYASYSRFNTPDSYQAEANGAYNPSGPGRWNRYAYVGRDPRRQSLPQGDRDLQPRREFPVSKTLKPPSGALRLPGSQNL